jgi:hypothetical protein
VFIPLVLIASQLYGYFSAYTVCGDDVIIMSKSPHSLVAVMGVVRESCCQGLKCYFPYWAEPKTENTVPTIKMEASLHQTYVRNHDNCMTVVG